MFQPTWLAYEREQCCLLCPALVHTTLCLRKTEHSHPLETGKAFGQGVDSVLFPNQNPVEAANSHRPPDDEGRLRLAGTGNSTGYYLWIPFTRIQGLKPISGSPTGVSRSVTERGKHLALFTSTEFRSIPSFECQSIPSLFPKQAARGSLTDAGHLYVGAPILFSHMAWGIDFGRRISTGFGVFNQLYD